MNFTGNFIYELDPTLVKAHGAFKRKGLLEPRHKAQARP